TPQLAIAVWVGYPSKLVPMLTQFHGAPVAGGTFPAEIWKAFATSAFKELGAAGEPRTFPAPPSLYTVARKVTVRDGKLLLDNGNCRSTTEIVYFGDGGPHRTASCKPNEVDVPNVVGERLAAAEDRLRGQPLTPQIVYKPAAPRQRLGVVLRQYPAGGTLSSFDTVTLVLAKPLHGVVPRVIGMSVPAAQARLRRLRLAAVVGGGEGVVAAQFPQAGVAAAPGMRVRLVVRVGSRSGSRGASTATVFRQRG